MKNIKKLEQGKYEIRFSYIDQLTEKRKRIRRRIEGTLSDAVELRDRLKVQAHDGDLGRSQKVDNPLSNWIDEYVQFKTAQGLRTSSIAEIKSALKTAVIDTAAKDWRPKAIQAHHIDQWTYQQLRSTTLSRSTISKRQGYLKRLIKYACKSMGLPVGFLRDVDAVKGSTKRKGRALTPSEAKAFLKGMKDQFPQHYALVFILLATGQRFGSVSALKWTDIDGEWLTFAESHYRGQVSDGSKTENVIRLPMTDQVKSVFDWHRRRMVKNQHPNLNTGLVFPTETPASESKTGGYRDAGDLRHAFQTVYEAIGIERITPHDLRRTFNSWAAERVSGTVLRSITGHSSASMTDHYYHGSREAKQGVVESITTLVDGT